MNCLTCFSLALLMLIGLCDAAVLDYESFQSVEEVITGETEWIFQTPLSNYEELSEAYIARGESYLFCENYEKAFTDLAKGYELAALCRQEVSLPLAFRALFSLAIANENTNCGEEASEIIGAIRDILDSYRCPDCSEKDSLGYYTLMQAAHHTNLAGPDKISVEDCIDRAQGTALAARALIVKVKRPEVVFTLTLLIDDLESKAVFCCRRGGLWKGCLQPIADKWHLWNQKWKVFGIPPDPSWD